ncbi:pyruvate, phosphate dikinase [Erysipelothrix rhusiopathiae]|uniref:pyruvate, phosphate dikinase n=1 Tax=Erysipelothrix rhusiopathiae TaxID=1648 RepID=UPI000F42F1EC|nr:pyruvate, phosphate dikinase [Erysipelothrix rhusiopathiae]AYV34151.1 pyruvate, phosphate dikinase [Erysipelothrix rhusiopathiae]MDE8313737.1 pyruvate, phosphate dikinase [Erysipelothrix rhusiopathiae]
MQYVYMFSEGSAAMRPTLGGKGANLCEMTNLGLPVPQGFVISTDACLHYYEKDHAIAQNILDEIFENLKKLESLTGKTFGGTEKPLLVSVRSGARVSMPGMMDTVLNLGLNDQVVEALAKDNEKMAYDSYRRLIQMYADVVMGIEKVKMDREVALVVHKYGVDSDHDLSVIALKELIQRLKETYRIEVGEPFPDSPQVQLVHAVEAVFRSWNNPRAKYYRKMHDVPDDWGTAVNIQEMVFGNRGEGCATGVAFSRNPATGEHELYGEFLYDAQGEDVVAGTHTPLPISTLKETMPEAYNEFERLAEKLEKRYHDMQDMEFTIEKGKLYMLQTRSGKRTAQAAVKIAYDMVHEGTITKQEAINNLDVSILDGLLHPQFDTENLKSIEPIAKGLPASPGASSGMIVFDTLTAVKYTQKGKPVILVRLETSPEDIEGMHLAEGILTSRGGMTSHAAVVARGMGKSCIVGCSDVIVYEDNTCEIDGKVYNLGDEISIDGGTGCVYHGRLKTQEATMSKEFETLLDWADALSSIDVYTNADTPADAQTAIEFGAKGIGLIRTEHMFFERDRIRAMREMILSRTPKQREAALTKILPIQRKDFEAIFTVMENRSVTVRYLDPPLHEFMPTTTQEIEELAASMNMGVAEIKTVMRSLHEYNPMMGHRGCRLAITYPEIALMQTQALIEAAINVNQKGHRVNPEIMIPLVGDVNEFNFLAGRIRNLADALIEKSGVEVHYRIGTMIELPRACLLADKIAEEAEFFSFGTNDLTQMTYGFSRDDAGTFLKDYYEKGIYQNDPFASLDQEGVGQLIQLAIAKARGVKPDLKIGICGEHGGDPRSVKFFRDAGFNYVSCSPYRVPIARISAAQTV